LTKAATKTIGNEADLAHRSFPSYYEVTASQSGATTPLLKVYLVGVTLGAEVEASVPDVLTA
jgi:hypothetical protein